LYFVGAIAHLLGRWLAAERVEPIEVFRSYYEEEEVSMNPVGRNPAHRQLPARAAMKTTPARVMM